MYKKIYPTNTHAHIPNTADRPMPRIYTPRFARAMCDLVEDLKATCKGQPKTTGDLPSAFETMQMEWVSDMDMWQFVDFKEIYSYLRGSKRLQIPDMWRPLIPKILS